MSRVDINAAIDRLLIKTKGELLSRIEQLSYNIGIQDTGTKVYCHMLKIDANGHTRIRWVLSIPFFISCIRQQNPLTVLSKIILRKVKQFNLPPPKKNEGFLHF